MQEDIKNQIKILAKHLEKTADENQRNEGYSTKTARLRLVAEIVKEQTDAHEINLRSANKK